MEIVWKINSTDGKLGGGGRKTCDDLGFVSLLKISILYKIWGKKLLIEESFNISTDKQDQNDQ